MTPQPPGRDPDGRPDTTGASVMGSRPGDKPNQRPEWLARLAPLRMFDERWVVTTAVYRRLWEANQR